MTGTSSTIGPTPVFWKPLRDHRRRDYVVSRTGHFLASMNTGDVAHDRANAVLMSASPVLLDALRILNEWSITCLDQDFPHAVVERAIDQATGRRS